MKYVWIPVLLSLSWIAVMFMASGMIVFFGIFVCWLAAILTLAGCLACLKAYRHPEILAESNVRITAGQLRLGLSVAIPVMLGCAGVAMHALSRAREAAKAPITSSNLRGIGQGLRIYSEKYGEYPADLDALVRADICSEGVFWSFGDPRDVVFSTETGFEYASFIYQPQLGSWINDPKIIVAYEREPWTPIGMRLIPVYGRSVLFADGHVQLFDIAAFDAACREDAARRRNPTSPATQP